MRVLRVDQPNFPSPSPVLHIPFSLPRQTHVVVMLGKDTPFQPVLLRKSFDETCTMFPSTPG
jgi:hypothetical protein